MRALQQHPSVATLPTMDQRVGPISPNNGGRWPEIIPRAQFGITRSFHRFPVSNDQEHKQQSGLVRCIFLVDISGPLPSLSMVEIITSLQASITLNDPSSFQVARKLCSVRVVTPAVPLTLRLLMPRQHPKVTRSLAKVQLCFWEIAQHSLSKNLQCALIVACQRLQLAAVKAYLFEPSTLDRAIPQ